MLLDRMFPYEPRIPLLLKIRAALLLPRALFHSVRLRYYLAALENIGHTHPDAKEITWRCIDSQRVVDAFLNGKDPATT